MDERSHFHASPDPGRNSLALLERECSLAALTGWLAAAVGGAGCTVLMRGEAGIGKTTLLREFGARQRDVRVLWGACDDLFTPRPLGPLHDIARQIEGPLPAALGAVANRDRIFTASLDELERTPTLVVLEDLHWADEATLDLLTFLGRRIARTRSMIVVSYRDDEVDARHPLRIVMGDLPRGSVHRLLLAPLSEAAVSRLAQEAGRPPGGLHGITGGNPLLLTEVLAVGTGAEAVPATVRDVVLARAARLTPAARAVAELVCVVPGRVEPRLLDLAAAADAEAVEECLRIGMVLSEDGALGYRHELVRRALEDSLPPPRRQDLHARVLAALVSRDGIPAARLAHHASGARDAEAVRRFAALAAIEAAAVGAHRQAVDHLDILVQYADDLAPAERAALLEQLSYECFLTGRYGRAAAARRGALEIRKALGEHLQTGETLSLLSRLSWFEGRRADAYAYSADALAVLESLPRGPALAQAYCHRADLDMEAHENISAIDYAGRAVALAEAWAAGRILSDALSVRGTARLVVGDAAGWEDLERCLDLALAGGFHEQVASAYTDLAAMAVSRRRYEAADCHLAAGLEYCEARDLDFLRYYLIGYRARMKLERGDWRGAGEDAEEVLRHRHITPITRIPVLRTLGHLRIRRGDPDADSPLSEARALAGPEPVLQGFGTLAAVRAEAAWLAGDREGVLHEVLPAYEQVSRKRDPRMKGELAAWLFRVQALDGVPGDIAEPYGLEIAGHWREAASAWEALGCPYEHALVLGWNGGESEQREALAIFEKLGATPAVDALRRRMRASGLRGVPRGARASTQGHPFGLTRREAQILALMRDGLRNAVIAKRLFLSPRTVDHHVSSVLGKLRVTSRAAAVEIARQQPESTA